LTDLWEGLVRAFQLILSGDPTVYQTTLLSLFISGTATIIATLWGTPIAMFLGLRDFRGKFVVKGFFNALIGIPTVALGLILYLVLSKSGPLGFLRLMYTPTAVIIGEALLVTPVIVSFATTAIEAVDPEITSLAKTLGASESQASLAVLKEAANGIFIACITSFNRAIAELGIALLVGGNIVLTTKIANEINFDISLSIALTIILLAVVLVINVAAHILRRKRK